MTASSDLARHVQAVLVDLIALRIQGKEAQWNVVGPNFRDLHLQLDEIVAASRLLSDRLAERLRALHAEPDGRTRTITETTTLKEFPSGLVSTDVVVTDIGERLHAAAATARAVHDAVDEEDPTTADLLHDVLETLEQLHWMLTAEHPELRHSSD
ncbi:DNA starvation/stationary phase protection protein [Arthrobacter sp. Y-9]|uniref:Dps family protein n=1 Tax=Arthrobacter sp. Y-9 TaxID=3039385 RepID=UPI00241D970D|nr:DNA starvation/stationary phase protection protein [Arthrobacter sp. Y-9]WFR85033.1 DNA starvation/stationary phase protection protein [Arthrobacter sp. Y-9]